MKKSSIAISVTVAAFLAACGESTTENVTQITQTGMDVVEFVKDLPKCTKDNEGEIAWVKGENSSRVCVDGKWFATKDTLVVAGDTVYMDGGDFSCTTKELKDKSGIKIICNGDSIGVVLNGEKGEKGADGEPGIQGEQGLQGDKGDPGDAGVGCTIVGQSDTTVTIKCGDKSMTMNIGAGGFSVDSLALDSEKVATPIASLDGYTQKGPFLKGSTVYLYELSDGRTLRQTNGNFMSYITSDDGRYQFNARNLVSQYAMVVVDGNYRNEVTGKNSERPIRLRAITDVTARSSANVNLLTNLEYERVYYLVTQKKMKVRNAKKQAQAEIFKAFHIDTTGFSKSSEDLDVFGTSDADGALLAISIMLQGNRDETDLSVLLTEISDDLATDGKWDGPGSDSIKAAIADWALSMDHAGIFATYRSHVADWGLGGGNVPGFEKYIRMFASLENGLGLCGSESVPVGMVKEVSNSNSSWYYASSFICADADSARWRIATTIEKDTMGFGPASKEGDIAYGRINGSLVYVYEGGSWRHGTELDAVVGTGCLQSIRDSIVMTPDSMFYKCVEITLMDWGDGSFWNSEWREMTVNEIANKLFGECTSDNSGTVYEFGSRRFRCYPGGVYSLLPEVRLGIKDLVAEEYLFDDSPDGGSSVITCSETYCEVSLGPGYDYPYAGIEFKFKPSETGHDITEWGGVCLTYKSTIGFRIELFTDDEKTLTETNNYKAAVPRAAQKLSSDFPWTKFKQEDGWGKTVDQATVLAKTAGIRLKIEGSAGTVGQFGSLEIGPLGTCE